MRRTRGRVVDIDSVEDLDRRLAAGARSLSGWRLRSLDLTGRGRQLRGVDVSGALFLGCTLTLDDEVSVRARGAVVFPMVPDVPIDTFRTTLYTPDELYSAAESDAAEPATAEPAEPASYTRSLDARAYAWSREQSSRDAALAQALHDHSIGLALADWIARRRLVGVMGGHDIPRGRPEYADGVLLGQRLSRSLTVATGGGPGAMEAVNLGGHLARQGDDARHRALEVLSAVPDFIPSIGAWARAAFAVRAMFPDGGESLGIPTWHYGHEPPNPFASAIAKYFRNAQREAILLEVCQAGIIFLPGAGGTVQEIFQDACENYYADESSVAPMILVGKQYWTQQHPAWQLLASLAAGRPMEQHVHLVETVQEAADLVLSGG
ncbi:LOG family protein [Microbacterium sp. USHLN186]|uniref:LOG family protein n=1 Tax=Microbacterium sp. USHLN186 TaxID=3081286 RepID=UPI003018C3D2